MREAEVITVALWVEKKIKLNTPICSPQLQQMWPLLKAAKAGQLEGVEVNEATNPVSFGASSLSHWGLK